MTEQTFRSALGGFNREDVVRYLEYINAQHTAELNQLRSEIEFLRSKEAQTPPPAEVPDQSELVQQQASRIRELFALCKQQEEKIAELTSRLEAVPAATASAEAELEAYRRAERVERLAKERSELVYHQLSGVLAEASSKVDGVADEIGTMAEQVMQQLVKLQAAVAGSKDILCDAASTISAIKPNN